MATTISTRINKRNVNLNQFRDARNTNKFYRIHGPNLNQYLCTRFVGSFSFFACQGAQKRSAMVFTNLHISKSQFESVFYTVYVQPHQSYTGHAVVYQLFTVVALVGFISEQRFSIVF